MFGALCLIMAGSTSVALAATVSPCGAGGTPGPSSCTYTTVGPDTFTVPPDVHRADFTVDGAQAPAGALGSQVGARLNVVPGETFHINVGGTAGGSDVSTGSGTQVLAAAGGGASDPGTQSAADVHAGNGQVTITWAPAATVPSPPAISIPGLDINLGALLSGVGGLVASILG
jgi:hypothetical protein